MNFEERLGIGECLYSVSALEWKECYKEEMGRKMPRT
jgi:hypothetical protein